MYPMVGKTRSVEGCIWRYMIVFTNACDFAERCLLCQSSLIDLSGPRQVKANEASYMTLVRRYDITLDLDL